MMAHLMWAEDPEGNYCLGYAGHVYGFLSLCRIRDIDGHEFFAIDPTLQHFSKAVWATRQQAVEQISCDCICQGHIVESDGE